MKAKSRREVDKLHHLIEMLTVGPASLANDSVQTLVESRATNKAHIRAVRESLHRDYVIWVQAWIIPQLEEMLPKKKTDFSVDNHGSIYLLVPHTDAARKWIGEHIPEDAQRWGRDSVAVEPGYLGDIIVGIEGDGLSVL